MRTISLLTLAIVLFSTGCKKETTAPDNRPACEKNQTATLVITNNSTNPYDLYNNNKFVQIINPKTNVTLTLSKGSHETKVVQLKGFLISPSVFSKPYNYTACETQTFVFP